MVLNCTRKLIYVRTTENLFHTISSHMTILRATVVLQYTANTNRLYGLYCNINRLYGTYGIWILAVWYVLTAIRPYVLAYYWLPWFGEDFQGFLLMKIGNGFESYLKDDTTTLRSKMVVLILLHFFPALPPGSMTEWTWLSWLTYGVVPKILWYKLILFLRALGDWL